MDNDSYFTMAIGFFVVAGICFAVLRGFILPKGAVIRKAWGSRREVIVVGLAVLFNGTLIGFGLSPYSSLPAIIGLGIIFNIIIRLILRSGRAGK